MLSPGGVSVRLKARMIREVKVLYKNLASNGVEQKRAKNNMSMKNST
jgi:hypothetical protein